jgi:hypothetical protein
MIWSMKRAISLLAAIFLLWCAAGAQGLNTDPIKPGDILIVKVLWPPKWRIKPVNKTVVVRPDGGMTPPQLQGLKPTEDVNVVGLGLAQAGQQLLRAYSAGLDSRATLDVVIERGTVDQLLNQ